MKRTLHPFPFRAGGSLGASNPHNVNCPDAAEGAISARIPVFVSGNLSAIAGIDRRMQ
jgi:hypothetical protein